MELLRRLESLDEKERQEVFKHLRMKIRIHVLEDKWNVPAEIILEAIARSQDITQRGIRGVIAELCFLLYVLDGDGWEDKSPGGDFPYDFLIKDSTGPITIQVKLQRQVKGTPLIARQWRKSLPESLFIVETQKTRSGKNAEGVDTRPYRFGEFDILAVSLHPSTNDWKKFMFTVGRWLIPRKKDPDLINVLQPVSSDPNDDWTDDFATAIEWFRGGELKTIYPGKL
ncbi:MAG: hypothetical protein HY896_08385 [Deltaproteobacteria bacterium]|nr:hypothetical protein [Deltaproteobacteria bacterium]